jgi:hypothetical protein
MPPSREEHYDTAKRGHFYFGERGHYHFGMTGKYLGGISPFSNLASGGQKGRHVGKRII